MFIDIIAFIWLIFLAYWIASAFGAKKSVRRKFTIDIVLRLVIFIIVFAEFQNFREFFQNYVIYNPHQSYALNILGVILCAAGVALAVWARRHLGKNWGMPMTMREEPELVTSGPYKYIRHPIYSGSFLALLGSSLVGGVVWLGVLAVVLIYFTFSAFREERLMTQKFPTQYPEYKKRTKMLIPFVF